MDVTIQSLHFTLSKALEDFIREKLSRLEHFSNRIISANVCLKTDGASDTENKVCEIRLSVPGNDLFAKRQCGTFEEATDQVLDALQQQIRKTKQEH
jgi:putative sigma-54 modulation protein